MTTPTKKSTPKSDLQGANNPDMQGEGNYTAARRHRESVEGFIESHDVKAEAKKAAPKNEAEKDAMRQAEKEGKSHARK